MNGGGDCHTSNGSSSDAATSSAEGTAREIAPPHIVSIGRWVRRLANPLKDIAHIHLRLVGIWQLQSKGKCHRGDHHAKKGCAYDIAQDKKRCEFTIACDMCRVVPVDASAASIQVTKQVSEIAQPNRLPKFTFFWQTPGSSRPRAFMPFLRGLSSGRGFVLTLTNSLVRMPFVNGICTCCTMATTAFRSH
jgi:hypothetical protein